ncbi:MAG: VOC family protein, partial [Ilumatobacteraceae bacterium]
MPVPGADCQRRTPAARVEQLLRVRGVDLRLVAVSFDAHDPVSLAEFWAGVLGREIVREDSGRSCRVTTPRSGC